jgi:hypothetical protein
MSKIIEAYLKHITPKILSEFQLTAFASFTSCISVRQRPVFIGVDTFGKFVVKELGKSYEFDTPDEAIEKYEELLLTPPA